MRAAPPIIRPTVAAATRRRSPIVDGILASVLLGFLAATLLVFSYCSACFDEAFKGGQWLDLGAGIIMLTILPLLAGGCFAVSLVLSRRWDEKLLVVMALACAILFGCPLVSIPLARGFSAQAATLWQPYKDRTDRAGMPSQNAAFSTRDIERRDAVERHFRMLSMRFKEPQRIARTQDGFVVLEDGTVLALWAVPRTDRMRAALDRGAGDLLRGDRLMVRLPERDAFDRDYVPLGPGETGKPGHADIMEHAPFDGNGWRYGAIPCLIYVDGRLINSRFEGTNSFRTFETYEPPRERAY